jgi:HEAT repeat protein
LVVLAGSASAAKKERGGPSEQELIAVIRSSAPPQQKAVPCKQLAVYGTAAAVPALAALLPDADLSSWARIALEAIPDPAADAALRQSLGQLKGRLLVGVVNSIGVRRDSQAVDLLAARLTDADPDVVSASAVALGRIGGPAAAKALEQALPSALAPARGAVAEGCILCAEKLLAQGQQAEALRLYDLVRKADVPKPRIIEATRGAILAGQSAGLPLLAEILHSVDKTFFNLGLRLSREMPGEATSGVLAAELANASPERQALLIQALAERADGKAVAFVLQTAKAGAGQVRFAAIRGLQRSGSGSCLPVLMDAALEANADASQAAIAVLAELPGDDLDADLLTRLASATGRARLVLIQIVGQRHVAAATPALTKAADDPQPAVRAAALTALGGTGGLADIAFLIARATGQASPEETRAAQAALRALCGRMPDRQACAERLAGAMTAAPLAVKSGLIDALAGVGGPKALQLVAAAARDPSSEVRDAAYRTLGEWMTADAATELLALAKSDPDGKFQVRALRGYLRIARQFDIPNGRRLAMYREALALARRDDEKRLAVEVLARVRTAQSLTLAIGHLGDPALAETAAKAAVMISDRLVAAQPAAVAKAMQQVLAVAKAKDTLAKAKALEERATAPKK